MSPYMPILDRGCGMTVRKAHEEKGGDQETNGSNFSSSALGTELKPALNDLEKLGTTLRKFTVGGDSE